MERGLAVPPEASAGFSCTGCGDCCRWPGHVLLTQADIARLAAALGLDERTFIDRHTRLASNRSHLSLCEKPDGSCEFLEGDRCVVHNARPQQCRDFPSGWRVEGCPALGTRTPNIEHRNKGACPVEGGCQPLWLG
jgi:hypothetical protein